MLESSEIRQFANKSAWRGVCAALRCAGSEFTPDGSLTLDDLRRMHDENLDRLNEEMILGSVPISFVVLVASIVAALCLSVGLWIGKTWIWTQQTSTAQRFKGDMLPTNL